MNKEMFYLVGKLVKYIIDHFNLKKYNAPIILNQMEVVYPDDLRRELYKKHGVVTVSWDGKKIKDSFNIYLYINNYESIRGFKKIDFQCFVNGKNKIYRCKIVLKGYDFKINEISEVID